MDSGKRKVDEEEVGPSPPPTRKKRVHLFDTPIVTDLRCQALLYAEEYLKQLPSGQLYEKSYMHKDAVTHISVNALPATDQVDIILLLGFSMRFRHYSESRWIHQVLEEARDRHGVRKAVQGSYGTSHGYLGHKHLILSSVIRKGCLLAGMGLCVQAFQQIRRSRSSMFSITTSC